jgi:hypothetical protein
MAIKVIEPSGREFVMIRCEGCNALLEYEASDLKTDICKNTVLTCPVCGRTNMLKRFDGTERIVRRVTIPRPLMSPIEIEKLVRPTCETCPYWFVSECVTWPVCHRYAPRPRISSSDEDLDNESVYWPSAKESDSCGEHPDFPAYIHALRKRKGHTTSSRGDICKGCGQKVDRYVCSCGEHVDAHTNGDCDHAFHPAGCTCMLELPAQCLKKTD